MLTAGLLACLLLQSLAGTICECRSHKQASLNSECAHICPIVTYTEPAILSFHHLFSL